MIDSRANVMMHFVLIEQRALRNLSLSISRARYKCHTIYTLLSSLPSSDLREWHSNGKM